MTVDPTHRHPGSDVGPGGVDVDRLVAAFVHALRRGGLAITVSQSTVFRASLSCVGLGNGLDVYWAGRSTLTTSVEHVAMYDAVFLAFFHHNTSGFRFRFDEVAEVLDRLGGGASHDEDGDDENSDDDENTDEAPYLLQFSRIERLYDKDFGELSDSELRDIHRAIAELRVNPASRRSRRRRAAPGGDALDLRRTVRAALRRHGEPIDLATTKARKRQRRLVLLLDVSGSMETYARVLIRFAHTAVIGRGNVEVFALGTRLTRITRQLDSRDPQSAIAAASDRVEDWSGGTRLGDSLESFVAQWGSRGMARGAVVVVVSDGWDRGEPSAMTMAMQRLHRLAYKVIWVNPLKAGPGYEPLAQGMAAALPYCDEFVEGHSLRSVVELAALVNTADR